MREYRCDIVMVNVSFYGTTGEEHPIVVRDSESAIVASAVPASNNNVLVKSLTLGVGRII